MDYTCGFCETKVSGIVFIRPKKGICSACYGLNLEIQAHEKPYSKLAKKLGMFLFGYNYYRKLRR